MKTNTLKKVTLLSDRIRPIALEKDVTLVPYYLGKALEYQIDIVCDPTKEALSAISSLHRPNMNFICKKVGNSILSVLFVHLYYLFQNASKINCLMCFHLKLSSILKILFYKWINNDGKAYLKLDTDTGKEFILDNYKQPVIWIRRYFYSRLLNKVDVISCETSKSYNNLCLNKVFGKQLQKKLIFMPNGFDEEKLLSLQIEEKDYAHKENFIITVGRLGTLQKNTEMFLRALSDVNLQEWKVALIGPIEKDFEAKIEEFYKKNPDKRNTVEFVGAIYDKKQLWEYYNKAKVFVLTSRWEGSPIVYPEAKRFRNYLVSTNVGSFEDITENGKYGCSVNQDDSDGLAKQLQKIINGEVDVNAYKEFDTSELSYEHNITHLSDFILSKHK